MFAPDSGGLSLGQSRRLDGYRIHKPRSILINQYPGLVFAARTRLGASNIELIDLLVGGLMEHLKPRNSWFVQPDFPYAETWWWSKSSFEVKDDWIVDFLGSLMPDMAQKMPA